MQTVYTSHDQWPLIAESRFASVRSDAELAATIPAITGSRVARCEAVFAVCARHWIIGTSIDECLGHLGERAIPQILGIRQITMIAGYVPLSWDFTEQLFCAWVLPDANTWSDYVIYFTVVPDGTPAALAAATIASGTLSQFTLCHPNHYEWHSASGIHAPAV